MRGAADVLHAQLLACIPAVGQCMPRVQGDGSHGPCDSDCIGGSRRQRIQFIVDDDNGFERVDPLEVQSVHGGEDEL